MIRLAEISNLMIRLAEISNLMIRLAEISNLVINNKKRTQDSLSLHNRVQLGKEIPLHPRTLYNSLE
jgi:hypothetical protein